MVARIQEGLLIVRGHVAQLFSEESRVGFVVRHPLLTISEGWQRCQFDRRRCIDWIKAPGIWLAEKTNQFSYRFFSCIQIWKMKREQNKAQQEFEKAFLRIMRLERSLEILQELSNLMQEDRAQLAHIRTQDRDRRADLAIAGLFGKFRVIEKHLPNQDHQVALFHLANEALERASEHEQKAQDLCRRMIEDFPREGTFPIHFIDKAICRRYFMQVQGRINDGVHHEIDDRLRRIWASLTTWKELSEYRAQLEEVLPELDEELDEAYGQNYDQTFAFVAHRLHILKETQRAQAR